MVVEDSKVIRDLLCHILNSDPDIQVVASAADGEDALHAVHVSKPDVITMDIQMPRMNGFDATRRIMEERPTPIVIVSGAPDLDETIMSFRAMEAGALAVLPRSAGIGHPDYERTAADLIRTVKLMSEVKVVRRWNRSANGVSATLPAAAPSGGPISLVAIGASTGGPIALRTIISALPASFPAPILVVQHISTGFVDGFADWLGQAGGMQAHVGEQGELIMPGHIYVAPDKFHMTVGLNGRLVMVDEPPDNGLRPSVSRLFRSAAMVYGEKAAGVLLSGMGKDGARELKLMKQHGSITIAQDRESSVVHGMPGEAIRIDAATYILPPEKIADALTNLANQTTDGAVHQWGRH